MIFSEKFKIEIKDIGKNNFAKNKAILEIFENIGTHHSDTVGYGVNDIDKNGFSWILLDWKLKVLKRPKYGQVINVNTWGKQAQRTYTYRDFEMYDEENNLCAIATSKWAIIDIHTGKILRLTNEIIDKYNIEEKNVFEDEKLDKININGNCLSTFDYKVLRKDIDLNGHMHNLYYLDLAYEVLPKEIFDKRPFENVRIEYRREIKLYDNVKCKYYNENSKNIIAIYNEDETKIHSIIELY